MPAGSFTLNAEDIRLAATPALEVSSGGLQIKVATHLERVAGGLRIATTAVDTAKGLGGGGAAALELTLSDRMEFSSGALRAKVKASEGMGSDASGYFVDKTQAFTWSGQHAFGATIPTVTADPAAANDLARRSWILAQIDIAKFDFDIKQSVRASTTGALAAHTRSGNVLTASANGALAAQDGITLALNDRLLVKNEGGGTHLENGLYFVSDAGSAGTPWTLTRTTDADASSEVTAGLFVGIEDGTTLKASKWVINTANPITLNTTALTFARYDAGAISAGAGLLRTGDVIDINLEASNPSLQVVSDELGLKIDANGGLAKGASGTGLKIEASKGVATTSAGLKAVEDANGGILIDANGIGVKVDATASGQLSKGANGARVATGGVGLPVKSLTVDTLASAFSFASGISSKTGFTAPDTHANSLDAQELFKGGIANMKRVAIAPAANGEWRFNGTTLEVFGDVTASGDTYRVKYLTAV